MSIRINMRNRPELGGGALPDIGVYPIVTARLATGFEPRRMQASVERDPDFGTDIYASVKADFGDFELSFLCSRPRWLGARMMVFHGDKGFIEVASPFNAGLYDHHRIELHDQTRGETRTMRFPGASQYRLQVEAFVRAAQGAIFRAYLHAGRVGEEPRWPSTRSIGRARTRVG